jgi:hypothetical protein
MTIPPGLEVRQRVKFTLQEAKVCQDAIKLDCMAHSMSVPVIAYPAAPRFATDREVLDLGTVGVESQSVFSFTLTNVGVCEGKFKVTSGDATVKIVTKSGVVQPAESIVLSGTFIPVTAEDFNVTISVTCDEALESVPPVILTAKSVVMAAVLLYQGGPLEELDFGSLYYGQKRFLKAILRNDSPYKRSFVLPPAHDLTTTVSGSNGSIFSASPSEGFLDANAQVEITFVFHPPFEHSIDGDIEGLFLHASSAHIVESGQRLEFRLTGKAVHHSVILPVVDLAFECLEVGGKRSQAIELRNESHYLPTYFQISDVPHFRIEPMKGVVAKRTSVAITITFFPKSLGDFVAILTVSFCNGLARRTVNLSGSAATKLDGAPFVRVPIFVREPSARFSLMHPDRQFQYTLDEMFTRQRRRQEFDSYICEDRRVATASDAPILEPPDPGLRVRRETSTHRRIMKSLELESNSKGRRTFDDSVLIKKKFKAKPATPKEVADCSHQITPAQQLLVTTSHQTISFGEVSVFSKVTKSFTITNGLQQTILAAMNYSCDELSLSAPLSQVIPSKQTAGFDVTFSAQKPCDFSQVIEYTLNGQHTCQVTVAASVVPIDIQLSRSLIEFRFSSDSVKPFIKEYVVLHNKSNTNAQFSWSGANHMFSLSITSGSVEANRTQNVEITYIPKTSSRDEVLLTLQVEGGPSRSLKCLGLPGNPKCQLLRKKIDFGLIPLGILKTQQLKIKNSGDDAIFTLCHESLSELLITPTSGRIPVHDILTLDVALKASQVRQFDIPVTIELAGAQPIVFNVVGRSELPKVQLSPSEFDFGKLFVGSSVSIDATLSNVGVIPAVLFLDLSSKPEFRMEFPSELADRHSSENCNSISLVSDRCFITSGLDQTRPKRSQSGSREANSGLVYKIVLIENSAIPFKLIYQPFEVSEHSFELPITLMNVVTASSFHLQPIVSAEAVKAPLRLSAPAVDFGIAPFHDPANPHCRPVVRSVVVTSEQRDAVTWRLGLNSDPLFGSVFLAEPKT